MREAADFNPVPGMVEELEPGLRRVLAPNPSPMTFRGTNTYLLGQGDIAVIDPGPADPAHHAAIRTALGKGERITHIFVTHSHLDHSPLARTLSDSTGAPVLAFGPSTAGRSPLMQQLTAEGMVGGGEGVDTGFHPDIPLADGTVIEGPDWRLTALWTPGHFGNHLSFAWEDRIFTGDHVMGWASSLVSPPDGDLRAYMASLDRLDAMGARVFYPGHGAEVENPTARLDWLRRHRLGREAEILAALGDGPATAHALAQRIYTDLDPYLLRAAERNVLAHLLDLMERNMAHCEGAPGSSSRFARA